MAVLLLARVVDGLSFVAPTPRALTAARRVSSTAPASVSMNALLSFTVGVSPVRNQRELEDCSIFFVSTFWPLSSEAPSAQAQLEADQLRDWVRRYDPDAATGREGTLLVAREFGRVVGVASVAATPWSQLGGKGGGGGGGAVFDPRAQTRDAAVGKKPSREEAFLAKPRPRGDKCPVLANLSVSPKARRRGIASKLAARAEAVAKSWGYDEIALAVESANEPAKRLYRKRGYLGLFEEVSSTKIAVQDERVRTMPTKNDVMAKPLR